MASAGFRYHSLRAVRCFMEEVLVSDADLEAFCLDNFGKRFFQIVASMSDRQRKLTHILVEHGTDIPRLLAALGRHHPDRSARYLHLLEAEVPPPEDKAATTPVLPDAPDPALIQRLYGVGAPLLSCDRGNQWREIEPLLCDDRHRLILLPGAHDQAHEFFLRRIEKGFRRDPPRRILRVSWRKLGTLSQPPFPSTSADAHAALMRTVGTPHRDDLPRTLANALTQHNLILLLPPLSRSFCDERLTQYYCEWLSVPLASLDTPYRCKFIQPIEWRVSPALMRGMARAWRRLWPDHDMDWVDLALSEADARAVMERIAAHAQTRLDVEVLSDLLPITEEDILRFLKDIVRWGDGTAKPDGERNRMARHVLSRAASSREILSLLLDLLPDAPSIDDNSQERDFHALPLYASS